MKGDKLSEGGSGSQERSQGERWREIELVGRSSCLPAELASSMKGDKLGGGRLEWKAWDGFRRLVEVTACQTNWPAACWLPAEVASSMKGDKLGRQGSSWPAACEGPDDPNCTTRFQNALVFRAEPRKEIETVGRSSCLPAELASSWDGFRLVEVTACQQSWPAACEGPDSRLAGEARTC